MHIISTDLFDPKLQQYSKTKKIIEEKLEEMEKEDEEGERFKTEPAFFCDHCKEEMNINLQKRFHCTECENFDFCEGEKSFLLLVILVSICS